MKMIKGFEVCDNCADENILIKREYHALQMDSNNGIIWYECGHVLIIKDGVVQTQFKY